MTEEQFKSLTETLETVGHYTPTVRDMFQFLSERKGYFIVDPQNPKAWRAYAGVKRSEGRETQLDSLDYFPEGGRFVSAISELLSVTHGGEDEAIYQRMAMEFGLKLRLTLTDFSAQFVITLPDRKLKEEYERYKALVNKL